MDEENVKSQISNLESNPSQDEIAGNRTDIDLFGGWINRMENLDPVLRTEASGKGLKLYDEIDRDAHAGSVLQTRYLSVVSKEWEVLPAEIAIRRSGRPATMTQEQKIADFVKKCFLNTNFDQARAELLQGILYGFYVAEVMWTVRNGSVTPQIIRAKHPRRFSFTIDRELRLLTPENQVDGMPLPDRKFIHFVYGSSDNPYGSGLGRKLWWPVWFKKNGIKFWVIFSEKFGMPTAVGKYAPGTPPAQQDALLDAIEAIQNETGIKIPETMTIELLEAQRTGSLNTYEMLCTYMDKQISKAVLGQTLTTEVGDTGSYAASQTHEGVRQDVLKADADLLCECLNKSLVKWIVDYNFPGVTDYPKLWIRTEPEQDLKALAERDKVLVSDIGLPVSRRYFYETYAIEEPEEGEETVGKREEVGKTGSEEDGKERENKFAEKAQDRFSQEDVDKVSQDGAKASQEAISALLEPVLTAVEEARSFEEIGERIYELYPNLDTGTFQDLLARAMFAVSAGGHAASEGGE